jgi:hypothetical protein
MMEETQDIINIGQRGLSNQTRTMVLMAEVVEDTKAAEVAIAKVDIAKEDTAELTIVDRAKDLKATIRLRNAKISTWATANTAISATMLMAIKI